MTSSERSSKLRLPRPSVLSPLPQTPKLQLFSVSASNASLPMAYSMVSDDFLFGGLVISWGGGAGGGQRWAERWCLADFCSVPSITQLEGGGFLVKLVLGEWMLTWSAP